MIYRKISFDPVDRPVVIVITTPGQSGPASNRNEQVTPHSSKSSIGVSLLDTDTIK